MSAPAPDALGPLARTSVRFAAFAAGGILMAIEILAFRVIDKTFGSALRETSVVISVFLAAMSLGYFAGGRWGDRRPRVSTLVATLTGAGLLALAIPALDRVLSPIIFASEIPLALHSTIVTSVLFALPTLLLATASPIAIRLLAAGIERSGRIAGGVAALSTVGSIAGSLAPAFVLLDLFRSVSRAILFLALAALGLALLVAAVSSLEARLGARAPVAGSARARLAAAAGALVVAAALAAVGAALAGRAETPVSNVLQAPARTDFRLGEVVFETDSRFHHITVVDRGRLRSLFFKHGETQSTMSLDDPYQGAAEYTDYFHLPMVLGGTPKRALFLGLGGGSAPKRFVRDYPEVEVDAVELDPVVVDVARRFFAVEPGPRLRIHSEDGRAFLARNEASWDLIGLDAYSTNAYGSTMPAHMATREFFELVASRLSAEGHLVMNVAAPHPTPIARAVGRTLLEVFPRVQVYAGGTGNTMFVAGRGERRWKRDEVVERAREGVASGRIRLVALPERAARMLTATLPVADAQLLTDDYAPVDRLMRESRGFGVRAAQPD